MKKNKFIVMAAACLQFAAVQYGPAQEIVPVNIHTLRITEDAGKLVYDRFGNADYIARCAADNGITNTRGLFLVYDRPANAIVVTDGTNVICTPFTFVNAAQLSSSNQVQTVERMTYVFTEGASIATGTMASTEHYRTRGETNVFLNLVAQIQYWSDEGTNGTAIYRGTITAGNAGADNNGGNGGNGGNHGGGGNHRTNSVPNNPKL